MAEIVSLVGIAIAIATLVDTGVRRARELHHLSEELAEVQVSNSLLSLNCRAKWIQPFVETKER